MLVSERVDTMRSASQEDPAWLGSGGNRTLLEEFASARAPGTVVRWGASGQRAFGSGGELSVEPPVELPAPYDSVLIHAAMAHHEVLHRVYSDDSGATAMAARLALRRPYLRTLGEQVFNWFEDARMAQLEHEAEPVNDKYPLLLHRLSVEQQEAGADVRQLRAGGDEPREGRGLEAGPVIGDEEGRRDLAGGGVGEAAAHAHTPRAR